jgi:Holliday junction resolvase RusA-like endonuclease
MMMIQFSIPIAPIPKGRPRLSRFGTYTPKKTKTFEEAVRVYAMQAMGSQEPLETALEAFLYFRVGVPQSYSKKRTEACLSGSERPSKKPDLDNLCKAVTDAFNGLIYKDDSQIVELHLTKVYDVKPGIDVLIKEA